MRRLVFLLEEPSAAEMLKGVLPLIVSVDTLDFEQRIGRIHGYGRESAAQVYNLVAADTIVITDYNLMQYNDRARLR